MKAIRGAIRMQKFTMFGDALALIVLLIMDLDSEAFNFIAAVRHFDVQYDRRCPLSWIQSIYFSLLLLSIMVTLVEYVIHLH